MENPSESSVRSERNLLWSVGIILLMSCICAIYTAYIIQMTLDSLGSSKTMALIIVDGGKSFKSDDATLEHDLNSATLALRVSIEIAYAMAVSSLVMATGLIIRIVKKP
jgi:hypothetical protein